MEARDDIDKVRGKSKQKRKGLDQSPPAVASATPEEQGGRSRTELGSREYQEYHTPYELSPSVYETVEPNDGTVEPNDETAESNDDPWALDFPNPVDTSLQRSGHIVPLSDESLLAIQVVLGRSAAKAMAGIRAGTSEFATTLQYDRYVFLTPTERFDPEMTALEKEQLDLPKELPQVAEFHNQLWAEDLAHCEQEDEATFHRTMMMSLIDRYRFIFGGGINSKARSEQNLTFSIEKPWICEPMPTRKYFVQQPENGHPIYTTRPKPDLCISFHTSKIFSSLTWMELPHRTRSIVCYEGASPDQAKRALGFFMIEAKNSKTPPDDKGVRDQVLNAASQALHNLYEFFREADQTDIFFARVRVFSAALSERGIIIRVHRAVRIGEEGAKRIPIVQGYPLQFEHKLYLTADSTQFSREKVVEAVGKIMLQYGERRLLSLLQDAAKKIEEKLEKAIDLGIAAEDCFNHYHYGQQRIPASKVASKKGGRKTTTPSLAGDQQGSTRVTLDPATSELLRQAIERMTAQSQRDSPRSQRPPQSQEIPPETSLLNQPGDSQGRQRSASSTPLHAPRNKKRKIHPK